MVVDAETGIKKNNRIRLTGATSQTEAIKAMYGVLKGIKDGEIASTRSAPDFKTFREHYRKVSGRSKVSAIREDNCLKHWEKFLGANMRISKINPRQILAYRGQMLARGLSASTANHHVKALRAVLKLARTEKYIQKLPFDGITPLKVKSVERKLFCTEDLLKIGTDALRNHPITGEQFADFLLLCMYSGGRKSEVANLKWENVDWQNRQLVFQGDTTKNFESRRVDFSRNLENHLLCMKAKALQGVAYLFPSYRLGKPHRTRIAVQSFQKMVESVRRAVGLPDFTLHLTRHYFISTCVMAGIDYMTIAKWVGHKDGGVLIGKTYGHLNREHMQKMASKLTF
ncbi:MAG TPA: tyrosine-type recombinase/integrase [Verrucomicrobiota bacterium]|nr:tyrosine-type recombinase/integrase [Verrucomicrobiota bacterium]HQL76655.1 tyrosine-type recombinase/integrase [Verrucomicrobiota bacterium]